ncbi:MAG: glycosyltransferase [Micrococcaceae bacterium]
MTPKVSVVLPCYNNADFIEQTLASILNQSYEDYEVIVADHSSTDGSAEILNKYADHDKVTVLSPTERSGGALRNWNRVSKVATGKYLKLVCGDDMLARDILVKQVKAFEENPEVAVVSCTRNIITSDGKVLIQNRGLPGTSGLIPGKIAMRKTVLAGTNIFGEPAAVLLKRELLAKVGYWNDNNEYYIDAGTYVKLLVHGDLYAIQEPLASFRLSDAQWSVKLAKQQAAQAANFHREVEKLTPDTITKMDIIRGDSVARAQAMARRAVYLWLTKQEDRSDSAKQ